MQGVVAVQGRLVVCRTVVPILKWRRWIIVHRNGVILMHGRTAGEFEESQSEEQSLYGSPPWRKGGFTYQHDTLLYWQMNGG